MTNVKLHTFLHLRLKPYLWMGNHLLSSNSFVCQIQSIDKRGKKKAFSVRSYNHLEATILKLFIAAQK